MKLLNILSITVMGTLFAVGCSSTTTITSDGGPSEGGTTDTGVKQDTGGTTDTGPKADTGTTGDAGDPCETCQSTQCKTEVDACTVNADKLKGCNDLINCINMCPDKACGDACISSSMSQEGKDLIACLISKCADACSGG